MPTYTYDEDTYSDLYKEVHGSRPGEHARDEWKSMSPAEKQYEWNYMIKASDDNDLEFNAIAILAMNSAMEAGAPDEATAKRWLKQADNLPC